MTDRPAQPGETVRYTGGRPKLAGLYAVLRSNGASITAVSYHDLSVHYLAHGEYLERPELDGLAGQYADELAALVTADHVEGDRSYSAGRQFRRLVLVPCGSEKADEASPAATLYTGSLYRSAYKAAQALRDAGYGDDTAVLILSAKHGLVHPWTVINPYNVTVGDADAITPAELRRQIVDLELDDVPEVIVLGARGYVDLAARAFGAELEAPVADLGGLGYMRSKLAAIAEHRTTEPPAGTYKTKAEDAAKAAADKAEADAELERFRRQAAAERRQAAVEAAVFDAELERPAVAGELARPYPHTYPSGGGYWLVECRRCELALNSGHHYPTTSRGLRHALEAAEAHNLEAHKPLPAAPPASRVIADAVDAWLADKAEADLELDTEARR